MKVVINSIQGTTKKIHYHVDKIRYILLVSYNNENTLKYYSNCEQYDVEGGYTGEFRDSIYSEHLNYITYVKKFLYIDYKYY